jgi:hypothetical protein
MSVHRLQTTGWINLSTLTSLDFTLNSIKLTNLSSGCLYLTRSATIPAASFVGSQVFPTETYSCTKNPLQTWIRAPYLGSIEADLLLANSIEPFTSVDLPTDVWTNSTEGFRRLKIDSGQTGFFTGKFFRAYIEALIPVAGPSVQFRFTSPIDFILWSQVLELTQGALELRVFTGASSTGSWTPRSVIGVNRMAQRQSPFYNAQITLETGGNFTGGTEVDLIKVRTSSANNSASNVGMEASERGLPAGVYHGRFSTLTGGVTVNDAAQMIYNLIWEERT